MTLLLNNLFIDSFNYFSKQELSISNALKLTDILLIELNINPEKEDELHSYLDNFIELNKLLSNYFPELDTEEAKLLNNANLEMCKSSKIKDKKSMINRLKEKRLFLYTKYFPELVNKVKELKDKVNLKAA
jgi:hypothetical protein